MVSPFIFTRCDASADGSIYVTGVVETLENDDVHHAILWERIAGEWKKWSWSNRCYGLATYPEAGRPSTAYLGFDGVLKVRGQVNGSRVQVLESSDDAPSSLRSVSCIRVVGEQLYVVGMRRMVYRRGFEDAEWARFDVGMRQLRSEPEIAGLRSIDGWSSKALIAVGLEGEIWSCSDDVWTKDVSPTNARLAAVRCLGEGVCVIGGAGVLLVGKPGRWVEVAHDFKDETFVCIERWGGRCFVCTASERVFELLLDGSPSLVTVESKSVWISATDERVYFLGRGSISSLSAAGWRDESPPPALMVGG